MKKPASAWLLVTSLFLVSCGQNPAVGDWDIEMNTPIGAQAAVLTINADGTGIMSADGLGEAAIDGITFEENALSFNADIDAQGQALSLSFTGTVEGDVLAGEFGSDFGAFGVTGARQR